jgi:hypothetical protein
MSDPILTPDHPTLTLLKEEINKSTEAQHDLAKWKLAVTAALGAAAFGLPPLDKPNYLLLFIVPFVCAYIDLYIYQYQLRTLVIARFIRESSGDSVLKAYEDKCKKVREGLGFKLSDWAACGSSIGATLFGAFFQVRHTDLDIRLVSVIWVIGAALVIGLYLFYQIEAYKTDDDAWKLRIWFSKL